MRSVSNMQKQSSIKSTDIAERSVRYTKDQVELAYEQAEHFIREYPGRSLAYAFLAGFVANHLPVGRILSGVTRLAFFAAKPAVLVYGATKLYHATQNGKSGASAR
jgi:hypothetical protein